MSIVVLKRKSKILSGTNRSGRAPGGVWVSRGPGSEQLSYSATGFSLNGGMRNNSINTSMMFSKGGTPFRGQHPIGYGGYRGRYARPEPSMNAGNATVEVNGNQSTYIKPSVLTTVGMLRTKYKWINGGNYPNYWVKPIYPSGPMSDNKSQGQYINIQTIQNTSPYDINKYGPRTSSNYTAHLQKPCVSECHKN